MKHPYKHFDLPTEHLRGEHYVPARARDEDEIARRRTLLPGALLAEQQAKGLRVIMGILEHVQEEPDVQFASELLSATGINTSWYALARDALVMRRRLYLPQLADDTLDFRLSPAGVRDEAYGGIVEAGVFADLYRDEHYEGAPLKRTRQAFGRAIGNASLGLGCLELGSAHLRMNAFDAQLAARQQGQRAIERARQLELQLGAAPSLAQLADVDSPLAVYWRRVAPNGAYQAYEEAIELAA